MMEDAIAIARKIRGRHLSATEATSAALERIRLHNPAFNCFTTVLECQDRIDGTNSAIDVPGFRLHGIEHAHGD